MIVQLSHSFTMSGGQRILNLANSIIKVMIMLQTISVHLSGEQERDNNVTDVQWKATIGELTSDPNIPFLSMRNSIYQLCTNAVESSLGYGTAQELNVVSTDIPLVLCKVCEWWCWGEERIRGFSPGHWGMRANIVWLCFERYFK